MGKKIDAEHALTLLENIYSICMLTTNFSLSTVLEKNNCNGLQKALIDGGFITAIKTKGAWLWVPEHPPTIQDAERLLSTHYGYKRTSAHVEQPSFNFDDKSDLEYFAKLVAFEVVDSLFTNIPGLRTYEPDK
jgi:hypothetical protein